MDQEGGPVLLVEPGFVVCLLKHGLGVGSGDHVSPQCVGDQLHGIVDSLLLGLPGPDGAEVSTIAVGVVGGGGGWSVGTKEELALVCRCGTGVVVAVSTTPG